MYKRQPPTFGAVPPPIGDITGGGAGGGGRRAAPSGSITVTAFKSDADRGATVTVRSSNASQCRTRIRSNIPQFPSIGPWTAWTDASSGSTSFTVPEFYVGSGILFVDADIQNASNTVSSAFLRVVINNKPTLTVSPIRGIRLVSSSRTVLQVTYTYDWNFRLLIRGVTSISALDYTLTHNRGAGLSPSAIDPADLQPDARGLTPLTDTLNVSGQLIWTVSELFGVAEVRYIDYTATVRNLSLIHI